MTVISTFADFVSAAAGYSGPKNWRTGQSAFNLLSVVRPDIAELLRGSDFDPFYSNDKLPLFYDFVMRHWHD